MTCICISINVGGKNLIFINDGIVAVMIQGLRKTDFIV